MIGIVVTGHGHFAEGLTSSVELIAGKQPQYEAVLFLEAKGPEALAEDLKAAIKNVDSGDGVLVFTDLMGGTPFKESVMIAMQTPNVEVLTGTNLSMLLEASLMRMGEPQLKDFAVSLIETGSSQVVRFDASELEREDDVVDGDGI